MPSFSPQSLTSFLARRFRYPLLLLDLVVALAKYPFTPKDDVDHAVLPAIEVLKRFRSAAIVAIHQDNKLCPNLNFELTSLAARGIALFVVNNGRLAVEEIERLRIHAVFYYERQSGKGRDFASYKFGTQVIGRLCESCSWRPDRVLLVNDSVLVIPDRFDAFLDEFLARQEPLVGVTESTEIQYHMSSWLLSFSWGLWTAKATTEYWAKYLPLHCRLWAIVKGEVGLSTSVTKQRIAPLAVYPASRFMKVLKNLPSEVLAEQVELLPLSFVRRYLQRAQSFGSGSGLSYAELFWGFLLDQENMNQTAFWQLFGGLYAGFPFIKKDIYYRSVFSLGQLRAFFEKLGASENGDIRHVRDVVLGVEDYRALPLYRRLRHMNGIE